MLAVCAAVAALPLLVAVLCHLVRKAPPLPPCAPPAALDPEEQAALMWRVVLPAMRRMEAGDWETVAEGAVVRA